MQHPFVQGVANTRNIPEMEFIDDVEAYLARQSVTPAQAMQILEQQYNKYKFMDTRIHAQKQNLMKKIPDINKALEVLDYLIQHEDDDEPVQTRFRLADTLHMRANLSEPKTVFLWLGARVMLEYPYAEAKELLEKNLQTAKDNLEAIYGDLGYLKNQITVSEVNIARLHNFNVQLNKK